MSEWFALISWTLSIVVSIVLAIQARRNVLVAEENLRIARALEEGEEGTNEGRYNGEVPT